MSLNSSLQYFLPKDKKIFPLFEQASANLVRMSKVLRDLMDKTDNTERAYCLQQLEELEHAGDKITHTLIYELGANFITPFDRGDVHGLASAIDDVADFMLAASTRIDLYRITAFGQHTKEIAEKIQQGTQEVQRVAANLRNLKLLRNVREACRSIKRLEEEAEKLYHSALARLFESEKDAVLLIKQAELLSMLKTAADKLKCCSTAIEIIVLKYS